MIVSSLTYWRKICYYSFGFIVLGFTALSVTSPAVADSGITNFRDNFVNTEDNIKSAYKPDVKVGGILAGREMMLIIAHSIKNLLSFLAIVVIIYKGVFLTIGTNTDDDIAKTKDSIITVAVGLLFLQGGSLVVDIFTNKGATQFAAAGVTDSYSMLKTLDNFQASILMPILNFIFAFLPVGVVAVIIYLAIGIVMAEGEDVSKKINGILASLAGLIIILLAKSVVATVYGVGNISPDTTQAASIVADLVNYILYLLGPVTIGILIYGGYLAIFSMGDTSKAAQGYKMIGYAMGGIIIVYSSYLLVNTFLVSG